MTDGVINSMCAGRGDCGDSGTDPLCTDTLFTAMEEMMWWCWHKWEIRPSDKWPRGYRVCTKCDKPQHLIESKCCKGHWETYQKNKWEDVTDG